MVYEKECAECGMVIDFGGEDDGQLPPNAIEFGDQIFCRECVQQLVMFGIGNVMKEIKDLEEEIEKIKDAIGLERH